MVTISWLAFSIHHRQCQPSSKFLVLHTIPGLLFMVGGLALHSLQQTVTSQCLLHLTTGVAIMILLPSSVLDFQGLSFTFDYMTDDKLFDPSEQILIFLDKTAGKEMANSLSVSSSLSVPGSAVKKGNKKPRKDVSVSFKQVLEEEEEGQEEQDSGGGKENVKMNGNSEVKEEHNKEDMMEKDISKDVNEANIDNNTQL